MRLGLLGRAVLAGTLAGLTAGARADTALFLDAATARQCALDPVVMLPDGGVLFSDGNPLALSALGASPRDLLVRTPRSAFRYDDFAPFPFPALGRMLPGQLVLYDRTAMTFRPYRDDPTLLPGLLSQPGSLAALDASAGPIPSSLLSLAGDRCPDDPAKTDPGVCGCGVPDTDADGDGVPACVDCNDHDAAVHPGATEVCDGHDDDCDGLVDTDDPDMVPCSEGNACTRIRVCVAGACVTQDPIVCVAPDACHDAACEPATGQCVYPPRRDGTPCEDGSPCTLHDVCTAGQCVGGPAPSCDDHDSCTDDGCDPQSGACTHHRRPGCCTTDTECADSLFCDGVETCRDDVCVPGMPPCPGRACDEEHHVCVTACAAASLVCPSTLAPQQPGEGEVVLDVGSRSLGAYAFTLTWDPGRLRLDGVGGGHAPEFADAPVCRIDAAAGTAACNAFQSRRLDGPHGRVSVARLALGAIGDTLTMAGLQITIGTLFDTDGLPICVEQGAGCTMTLGLCGDVDGDGGVDIADALLVAQFGVGLRACGAPPFDVPEACDVNPQASTQRPDLVPDGVCDIGDALRMAQCAVGLTGCEFSCRPLPCTPPGAATAAAARATVP